MTVPSAAQPLWVGFGLALRLDQMRFGRPAADALAVASLSAVVLAVYSATLAHDLSWGNGGGDGAELATAAYVMGVAHPPGYPLYLSVLRVAQLAPFGEVAVRSNAFSALAAVVAAALLSATLTSLQPARLGGTDVSGRIGASFGAAVFAFAPLIWSQAVVTEVYTFEAFLLSLFLLALVRYCRRPCTSRLILTAASLGLLMSHHLPFAVLLVPLAWVSRAWSADWRSWLLAITLPLPLALLLLATVAVRATFQPWLSWGEAVTLGDWFAHVTAASYQRYFLSATLAEDVQRTAYAAATLVRQGGWLATGLAAVGISWLWHEWRPVAVMFCTVAVFFVAFAVLYNARDSLVYLAPVVTVLALGAGLGATWLLRLASHKIVAAPLMLVLLMSIGWQLVSGWPEVDVARDTSAREWATHRLQGVPEGGVVHVQADEQLFALWYLQGVEGVRADVVVVDDRLLTTRWFCRQLNRQHPEIRECNLAQSMPAPA